MKLARSLPLIQSINITDSTIKGPGLVVVFIVRHDGGGVTVVADFTVMSSPGESITVPDHIKLEAGRAYSFIVEPFDVDYFTRGG